MRLLLVDCAARSIETTSMQNFIRTISILIITGHAQRVWIEKVFLGTARVTFSGGYAAWSTVRPPGRRNPQSNNTAGADQRCCSRQERHAGSRSDQRGFCTI